jgi:hypothetical protein
MWNNCNRVSSDEQTNILYDMNTLLFIQSSRKRTSTTAAAVGCNVNLSLASRCHMRACAKWTYESFISMWFSVRQMKDMQNESYFSWDMVQNIASVWLLGRQYCILPERIGPVSWCSPPSAAARASASSSRRNCPHKLNLAKTNRWIQ